jgi:hypothetical protein
MTGSTPELRALARRLVAFGSRTAGDAAEVVHAMEAACGRLNAQLEGLIAPAGVRALLRRALSVATAEFAWLTGVGVEDGGRCSFVGLREAVQGRSFSEVDEAFVAVVANVLWLLVTFIGEDLTLRLVREAWPELRDEGALIAKDEGDE